MIKLAYSSKFHSLSCKHKIELEDEIRIMYVWYLEYDRKSNEINLHKII